MTLLLFKHAELHIVYFWNPLSWRRYHTVDDIVDQQIEVFVFHQRFDAVGSGYAHPICIQLKFNFLLAGQFFFTFYLPETQFIVNFEIFNVKMCHHFGFSSQNFGFLMSKFCIFRSE